ncbi:DUF3783 domain-containing protein [Thermococcus sp. 2319x1]|uniref:DUF3783 domain-containing protein n=1 Tax=Thermococcus sp. 2319x1 TaxID=1674923 RepID=UPI0015817FE7|nr:DUF3783 domain-containing protein [Thermococcus sp. 2319x1]
MILIIGFEQDEVSGVREILSEFDIYEVPEYCKDWVVEEVVAKAPTFQGSGNWHWRKFIIMHNLSNEEVKRVIKTVRSQGINPIFATTTPTSLTWKLEDLLDELVREDEYFRKLREEKRRMKSFYLDIGKS